MLSNSWGPLTVTGLPATSDFSLSYVPSATTLFRFSALTFNGHFIHLDKDYAHAEGYSGMSFHALDTQQNLHDALNRQSGLCMDPSLP